MRPGWASGRRPRRSLHRRWGTSRTQCCAYVLLLLAQGILSQYACLTYKDKPLLLLLRPRISGNTSSVDPCSIGFPAKNPKCRHTPIFLETHITVRNITTIQRIFIRKTHNRKRFFPSLPQPISQNQYSLRQTPQQNSQNTVIRAQSNTKS